MNHQNNKQQQPQPKYRFYATLLDAFQYYLTSEYDNAFQEFIDKVNRVSFSSEAAEKGTAFNELVDIGASGELYNSVVSGKVKIATVRNVEVYQYQHTDRNGYNWNFEFPIKVVDYFAMEYKEAVPQVRTSGYIQTQMGLIELYGNLDELLMDLVSDIKTTKSYEFPKYLHNFQHLVYPFTLKQEGIDINLFRYHVTDFKNIYKEEYVCNPEKDEERLRNHCTHLAKFLEMNRHLITDKKIFAMDDQDELAA